MGERVNRPWGCFEQFTENTPSTVKIITVDPEENISFQFHHERDEFWKVLSGECLIVIGDLFFKATKGDEFFIPKEVKHRIKNSFLAPAEILEISFGKFNENDIIRIEDDYGRI